MSSVIPSEVEALAERFSTVEGPAFERRVTRSNCVMMRHRYFVYIVASKSRVLYIGVTNGLERRIREHKNDLVDGFSKQYRCHRLVYESFDDVKKAIDREKRLKRWNRTKKVWLIQQMNPTWEDLVEDQRHQFTPEKQVPPLAG